MKELEVEDTRRKIKYPAAAMLVNSNGSIKLVMSTLIFDWENKKRYQVFIEDHGIKKRPVTKAKSEFKNFVLENKVVT